MEQLKDIGKILVPVDYSECSIPACLFALKVAKKTNAEIAIFHAFYSPAYDLIELTGNKKTKLRLREDITRKLMMQEEEKTQEFRNMLHKSERILKVKRKKLITILRPGLAKDEIQKLAQE